MHDKSLVAYFLDKDNRLDDVWLKILTNYKKKLKI